MSPTGSSSGSINCQCGPVLLPPGEDQLPITASLWPPLFATRCASSPTYLHHVDNPLCCVSGQLEPLWHPGWWFRPQRGGADGEGACLHQGKRETSPQVWRVAEHPPTGVSVKASGSIPRGGSQAKVESCTINTGTSGYGRSENPLMGTTGKNPNCP